MFARAVVILLIIGFLFVMARSKETFGGNAKRFTLIVFQTHQNKAFIDERPLLKESQDSWKKVADKYEFYDNDRCLKFIKDNFDDSVRQAYEKVPLNVMRADLWRYCVVYKYGGLYADADSYWTGTKIQLHKIFDTKAELTVFPELTARGVNETGYYTQWIFSGKKGSPILKSVIDLSVSRILKAKNFEYDDGLVHHMTGPAVFTEGIRLWQKANGLSVGSKNLLDNVDVESEGLRVLPRSIGYTLAKHVSVSADKDFEGWKLKVKNKTEDFSEGSDLFFLHVPKTGGGTMELLLPPLEKRYPKISVPSERFGYKNVSGSWEVAPHLFLEEYDQLGYLDGRETFSIVRDPFERFVSEANFRKRDSLDQQMQICEEATPFDNHDDFMHCLPQTDIVGSVDDLEVDNLFLTERIDDEVLEFLKERGVTSETRASAPKNHASEKKFSVENLSDEHREWIKSKYKKDIELYEMYKDG